MFLIDDIRIGDIMVCTLKTENENFCFNCTSRADAGFVYITDGDGFFTYNDEEIAIKRYDMIIVQKNDRYSVKAGKNGISYITTGFTVIPENAFRLLNIPHLINIENFPHFEKRLFDILKIWQERNSFYIPKARVGFEKLLLEIINIYCPSGAVFSIANRLSPAIEYINRNYNKKFSNEELAKRCNMSVSHFRRIFKEKFGVTPMQFRDNIRIYWAKELIESQMFSLSEISDQLGFSDIYHFSKNFKKATGQSPSHYKKE